MVACKFCDHLRTLQVLRPPNSTIPAYSTKFIFTFVIINIGRTCPKGA